MERGLYIHIPFCVKKCNYCDFNSFEYTEKQKSEYVQNVVEEIRLYTKVDDNKKFSSVFIGGGTPSLLNSYELTYLFKAIYDNLEISCDAEISIEVNPGTVDEHKLKTMYDVGINRLSFGLQASQNEILKYLGRIHTYDDFLESYNCAKKIGFKNINIDLIFGVPSLTLKEWKETLEKIIDLNPTHISAYSLILEEGTKFYEMFEKEKFEVVSEDLDLSMYHQAKEMLKHNGYNQYEISNFAKNGYECKHNIIYWECKEYLGVGLGAHSYMNGCRYNNEIKMENYLNKIKKYELPTDNLQILSKEDKIEEKIFMGLRMNKGLCLESFKKEFDIDLLCKYSDVINKLNKEKLIDCNGMNIFLTKKGIDVSNRVFVEFLR